VGVEHESKSHPLEVPLEPEVVYVQERDGEAPEVVDHCHEVEDAGNVLVWQAACGLEWAISIREKR